MERLVLLVMAIAVRFAHPAEPELAEPDPLAEYSAIPNFRAPSSSTNLLSELPAVSSEACAVECTQRKECEAFQFGDGNDSCMLLSTRASMEGYSMDFDYYERKHPVSDDVLAYMRSLQSRREEAELYQLSIAKSKIKAGPGTDTNLVAEQAALKEAHVMAMRIREQANRTLARVRRAAISGTNLVRLWAAEDHQLHIAEEDPHGFRRAVSKDIDAWQRAMEGGNTEAAARQIETLIENLLTTMGDAEQAQGAAQAESLRKLRKAKREASNITQEAAQISAKTEKLNADFTARAMAIEEQIPEQAEEARQRAEEIAAKSASDQAKLLPSLNSGILREEKLEAEISRVGLATARQIREIKQAAAKQIRAFKTETAQSAKQTKQLGTESTRDAMALKERVRLALAQAKQRAKLQGPRAEAAERVRDARKQAAQSEIEVRENAREELRVARAEARQELLRVERESFEKVVAEGSKHDKAAALGDLKALVEVMSKRAVLDGRLAVLQRSRVATSNESKSAVGGTANVSLLEEEVAVQKRDKQLLDQATAEISELHRKSLLARKRAEEAAAVVKREGYRGERLRKMKLLDGRYTKAMLREAAARKRFKQQLKASRHDATALLSAELKRLKEETSANILISNKVQAGVQAGVAELRGRLAQEHEAAAAFAERKKGYLAAEHQIQETYGFQLSSIRGIPTQLRLQVPRLAVTHTGSLPSRMARVGGAVVIKGRVYATDAENHVISSFDLDKHRVYHVAGNGGNPGSVDGAGERARFSSPTQIIGASTDGMDVIYVLDQAGSTVRRVAVRGTAGERVGNVSTVAKVDGGAVGLVLVGTRPDRLAVIQKHSICVLTAPSSRSSPDCVPLLLSGALDMASADLNWSNRTHWSVSALDLASRCVHQLVVETGLRTPAEHLRVELPHQLRTRMEALRVLRPGVLLLQGRAGSGSTLAILWANVSTGVFELEQRSVAAITYVGRRSGRAGTALPVITALNQVGRLQIGLELECRPRILEDLVQGWAAHEPDNDPEQTHLLQRSSELAIGLSAFGRNDTWRFWGTRKVGRVQVAGGSAPLTARLTKHMLCSQNRALDRIYKCCTSKSVSLDWPQDQRLPITKAGHAELEALLKGY